MAVATRTLDNFIGGRWVPATTEGTVDDLNPAEPSDVLACVPLSSAEDARAAIAAASDAFPAWRAMSPVRRGQVLIKASRILEDRQEEIAQLITREQGKTLAESRGEVPRAIQFWGWMGYQGGSIQGVTAPAEADEVMALTLPGASRRRQPDHPVELPGAPGARGRRFRGGDRARRRSWARRSTSSLRRRPCTSTISRRGP